MARRKPPQHVYPMIDHALNNGTAFREGNSLVGRASDGEEVIIGTLGLSDDDDAVTEAYLVAHPTPDTW